MTNNFRPVSESAVAGFDCSTCAHSFHTPRGWVCLSPDVTILPGNLIPYMGHCPDAFTCDLVKQETSP